ncbi:MAG: putative toxin-antitoxin system toxin component, PIN family [Methyloversatilis sp.]|nr:putative toxin-antitoxin system toxin component, PIN family [Methyloversatilis sp.]
MHERRWVLDTNTLISRLLLPSGVAARAVDHALARGIVLVSAETMEELAEMISRPKFDRYVPVADRIHFLRLFGGVARMVNITHRVAACRDPKDDKFLHVALNGEAEAIVTGDQDLLVLHPFHGISVFAPAAFLMVD